MSDRPADVVERWIDAYNALDWDGMQACLDPDLDFAHYNLGFAFPSASELIATLKTFASDYLPDRHLGPALRVTAGGDVVIREQMWTGTLAVDLPGFGGAGDPVEKRLATVFTVRNGRIVQYYDYG